MKAICKRMLIGGGKIAYSYLLYTLLSLALIISSCTDETEAFAPEGTSLQLNVRTAGIETRGFIESATLPDASAIGLTLTDAGGTTYDNIPYNNIKTTASTGKTPQTWTLSGDMLLSSTAGTLYGYYPYNNAVTDITQVPVTAGDTDYMYATPVTGLDDGNSSASVIMNHALAAIRLNIVRGTYTGTGAVTEVSVSGANIATSGTLNARTGALSAHSGVGSAVTDNTAFTLSTTAQQIDRIIVPVTGTSAAPTFTVNMDDSEYTVTPFTVSFTQGTIYEYTLTVDAKDISVSDVQVGDWGYNDSGNPVIEAGYRIILAGDTEGIAFSSKVNADGAVTITAVPENYFMNVNDVTFGSGATITQKLSEGTGILYLTVTDMTSDVTITFNGLVEALEGTIDLTTASNGVYAVAKNGKGVTYAEADESCIAVALIVNDAPTPQRLMIEKNFMSNNSSIKDAYTADNATDTNYKYLYWGYDGVIGIEKFSKTPTLDNDYTLWTSGALSDFNGKQDTEKLISATHTYTLRKYAVMSTYCIKFNETLSENQGYTDWYIPALGQLGLIALNLADINDALTSIGGKIIKDASWSTTTYGTSYGSYHSYGINWEILYISMNAQYNTYGNILFIRDIN